MKSILFVIISIITLIFGTLIGFVMILQPVNQNFHPLNSEFSLHIGESANIKNHGIKLKFIDVLEDSRCPSDVECVWEGTVSLSVNIEFNNQDLGIFILNMSNLHKASFMSYYVKFKELDPYPISTEVIQKGSYVATFIVNEYGPD